MSKPVIYVPFGCNNDFTLYTVDIKPVIGEEAEKQKNWRFVTAVPGKEIIEKLKNLRDYYVRRYYGRTINAEIQLYSDKKHIVDELKDLPDSAPSIFLGLFLAAAEKIQNRVIKESWKSVTVTGDLNYNSEIFKMSLKTVDNIDKKYEAVKAYAEQNKDSQHLFVYVSEKEYLPENKAGNIDILWFTETQSIYDVVKEVFEPPVYRPLKDLDDERQRFFLPLDEAVSDFYIATNGFEEMLDKTEERDWRGIFIHGEGSSGKSAMAVNIARYLYQTGRIYAPLWVKIIKDELRKIKASPEERISEKYRKYLVKMLYRLLEVKTEKDFENAIKEKRYLFIFDNLKLDEKALFDFILAVNEIVQPFNIDKKPFVIITSRLITDEVQLKSKLNVIRPSELDYERIESFILYYDKNGKISELKTKDSNLYRELISGVFNKLASSPGLIAPFVASLRNLSAEEGLTNLRACKGNLRENITEIFKGSFKYLKEKTQVILFLILDNVTPDTLKTKAEIFYKYESTKKKLMEFDISVNEIQFSLNTLLDYGYIYKAEDSDNSRYAIKTSHYLTFMFEPEFCGIYIKEDEVYLREHVVQVFSKLNAALEYDQDKKFVEPILNKITRKNLVYYYSEIEYPLFDLAENAASIDNFELLLEYCPELINIQRKDRETLLMRAAAINRKAEIVKWLLDNINHELIHIKDMDNLNALMHAAIENSNPEIIKIFVNDAKFDPNEILFYGNTPFTAAVGMNPNPKIIDCFINDLKCDINSVIYADRTPLLNMDTVIDEDDPDDKNISAINENFKRNAVLLKKHLKKMPGFPVIIALTNPNIEVFKTILEHKVNFELIKEVTGAPLIFHAAGIKSNPEWLELLKEYGCNIFDVQQDGWTALHNAALSNYSIPVFEWLVNNGLKLDALTSTEGAARKKNTPFEIACGKNPNPEVIDWFINEHKKQKIEINLELGFLIAVRYNSVLDILKVFLKHGIKVENVCINNVTPLHVAVYYNPNSEIYKWLIENGVNPNAQNILGNTSLHCAADIKDKKERRERVKYLLDHGADPDISNNKGKKALTKLQRFLLRI